MHKNTYVRTIYVRTSINTEKHKRFCRKCCFIQNIYDFKKGNFAIVKIYYTAAFSCVCTFKMMRWLRNYLQCKFFILILYVYCIVVYFISISAHFVCFASNKLCFIASTKQYTKLSCSVHVRTNIDIHYTSIYIAIVFRHKKC